MQPAGGCTQSPGVETTGGRSNPAGRDCSLPWPSPRSALRRSWPVLNQIFIATMIGSQNADCKDLHTVGFPDFLRAGEQGSAKSPPRGSGSFADFFCRGCPSKSQVKKPRPTKNFERRSKAAFFTIRSVRHPQELSVRGRRLGHPPSAVLFGRSRTLHTTNGAVMRPERSKGRISRFRSLGGTVLDLRRENSFRKNEYNHAYKKEAYRRQEKCKEETLPNEKKT